MAAGTLTCAILSTLMVIVFPGDHEMDHQRRRHERVDWTTVAAANALAAIAFLLQHGFNALRIILNNTFEQR